MYRLVILIKISVVLMCGKAGCYVGHYKVPSEKTNSLDKLDQIYNNSSFNQNRYNSTKLSTEDLKHDKDIVATNSSSRSSHMSLWRQIQRVCGYYKMCYNEDEFIGYSLMSTCCPPCSCHLTCVLANNCCPDADIAIQDESTSHTVCLPLYNVLTHNKQEQTAHDHPDHNAGIMSISIYDSYLTVSACPTNTKNTELVNECLQPQSIYTSDHIPVLDVRTRILYKNPACAQCHNATGYLSWELVTNCTSLYLMDSSPVFIKDLRSITAQGCLAYLNPSSSVFTQSLRCNTNKLVAIQACNVTGLWNESNPYILRMCEQESHMTWYTHQSRQVYKNVYCYLCNIKQSQADSQICVNHYDHYNEQTLFSGKFNAKIPLTAWRGQSATIEKIETPSNDSCSNNYVMDVYSNKCRLYKCPLNAKAMYSICLDKPYRVTGLVVVGKLHIKLTEGITAQEGRIHHILSLIQRRLTSHLQVSKHGCIRLPGAVYGHMAEGQLHDFYLLYKIQNSDSCSVEMVISLFSKIDTNNIVLQPDQTSNDHYPRFSVKMTYKSLDHKNFTFTLNPPAGEYEKHEVLLNASFHCQRVILTVEEYQESVDAGKLQPLNTTIIQQEYTQDTGLVEVCLTDYLQHWFLHSQPTTVRPFYYNKVDVTLSVIATVISMLSITVVMITYCLFSDLRFVPGKLVMILCTNLFLAQAFYAFGLDLGVDNFWCKLFGICIHFFWLATLFTMNSILFLMLRSLQRPLDVENREIIESRSIIELIRYIAHCYTLPFVCVVLNMFSSSVNLTKEFGYGGSLCYIRTAKMRLLTFGVPLGIVMFINFILFALIMITMSKYIKTVGKKVPVRQIFIFFKLITITGMYWLFGFLYEFTKFQIFSYLFIVLNAGQGFFLMLSFLYNSHIYSLYRTAIDKYIRKLREYSSESASTA